MDGEAASVMHPAGAFNPAAPPFPTPNYHVVPMLQPPPPPPPIPVRRVWDINLVAELRFLRHFASSARYAAVTIHYPGVVHGGAGAQQNNHALMTAEERYGAMKANVDALKPIQLGLAVYNEFGHLAAWEFNIRGFHPAADPHAPNSVEYLERRGLSFRDHQAFGVDPARLAAELDGCGMFRRRPGVSWITYAGAFHVAYLMKVLSAGNGGGNLLPDSLGGFLDVVRQRLSDDIYDVARMAVDCGLPPGLERVASALWLVPASLSPCLAGASSVLALQAFMRLKYDVLGGKVDRFRGLIHGIQVV
ncbi:probable CCR4-associated factor 1 homolog 11 [Setaria italica]|nr:probable CCR4-associated factor 1 homolog 11 [Setaria italica]